MPWAKKFYAFVRFLYLSGKCFLKKDKTVEKSGLSCGSSTQHSDIRSYMAFGKSVSLRKGGRHGVDSVSLTLSTISSVSKTANLCALK